MYKIIDYYKNYLTTLDFAGNVGGLVVPLSKQDEDNATIVFPAYRDTDPDTCTDGQYRAMTPDDSQKSVMYFEEITAPTIVEQKSYYEFEARVRLVCWLNYSAINYEYHNTDLLQIKCIKAMPEKLANGAVENYNTVRLWFDKTIEKKEAIFSAYTYDKFKQYLMFPFDYFAIEFILNYRYYNDCEGDVELNPVKCL